jgi:hypothetical protein
VINIIVTNNSHGELPAEAIISLGVFRYINGVLSNRYPHALYNSRSTIEMNVRIKRRIEVKVRRIYLKYLLGKKLETATIKNGITEI